MSTNNCMYKLKPIINRSELILNSTSSMYKLKNLQSNGAEGASVQTNDITTGTKRDRVQGIQEQSADDKMVKEIEERQGGILKQLQNLQERLQVIQKKVNDVEQLPEEKVSNQTIIPNVQDQLAETMAVENINGLVIKLNSKIAPVSLLLLRQLWANDVTLNVSIYHHSSASSLSNLAQNVATRLQAPLNGNATTQVTIELILKEMASACVEFTLPHVAGSAPIAALTGEVNLLRYLSRVGPAKFNYERIRDVNHVMYYEKMFDHVHRFIYADTKTEQGNILRVLSGHLGKKQWFGAGNTLDVLDVACYSAIIRANYRNELPNAAMTKWVSSVEKRFNLDALLKN